MGAIGSDARAGAVIVNISAQRNIARRNGIDERVANPEELPTSPRFFGGDDVTTTFRLERRTSSGDSRNKASIVGRSTMISGAKLAVSKTGLSRSVIERSTKRRVMHQVPLLATVWFSM
jgi:hypothetical protein